MRSDGRSATETRLQWLEAISCDERYGAFVVRLKKGSKLRIFVEKRLLSRSPLSVLSDAAGLSSYGQSNVT